MTNEAYALSTCNLSGFEPREVVKLKSGALPNTVIVHGNKITVAIPITVFEQNFRRIK